MIQTTGVIFITALIFGGGMYIFMSQIANINRKVIEDQTKIIEKQREYSDLSAISTTESYENVSAPEAKELIDNDANIVILDVSNKYDEGHLPNAINYYVSDGSLDDAIPSFNKNKKYLVYCHVDSASILGAEKLVEAGIKNVYRLEGNYSAWVEAGYVVED